MPAHSWIINAWSLSEFVGFCLSTRLLRIDHKFSMGLRYVEFPRHGPKISMFCSPSHLVITFALWQGAPSCWKRHCSSPNCSWMVKRSCSWSRENIQISDWSFATLFARMQFIHIYVTCHVDQMCCSISATHLDHI